MNAMRRLHLEHLRNGAGARRRCAAALAGAVAIAAATAWQALQLSGQAAELQQRVAAQAGRAPLPAAARAQADQRAARARQAAAAEAGAVDAQLQLPWAPMFQAIEAAATPDVSLLALDAAPERQAVKLNGEARNMAALLDYLRVLGRSPFFRAVQLQSHHVEQGDALRPVRFVVLLSWARPA